MAFSVLFLATAGGFVSFLSTSLGVLLSLKSWKSLPFLEFKFSIDFALGLMLSAVAFSLVGPAAFQSIHNPSLLMACVLGFAAGGLVIYGLKAFIERNQTEASKATSSQLLLALALIIHNFPEGLASGASLAGLSLHAATPILTSISIQNIPEGLLMVLCLRAMGWTKSRSLIGGLFSGVVELIGGVTAGFAMSWTSEALPIILMLAGGAMFTSVAIEIAEKSSPLRILQKPEFAMGLFAIPVLNIMLS